VQAKCKVAETATEDGKALLNYAKQPTTPNNEQRTTSEQRRGENTRKRIKWRSFVVNNGKNKK